MDDIPMCNLCEGLGRWVKENYPLFILIFFLLGAITLSFCYENFQKEVVIKIDSSEEIYLTTWKTTVEDVIKEVDIYLGPMDEIYPSLDQALEKETEVLIKRAFPVYVLIDNDRKIFWTTGNTVGQIIEELEIWVGEFDEIQPNLDTIVEPGTEINISRTERIYIVEQHEIPYAVIKKGNSNLDRGITRIIQRGEPGLREDQVEVVIKDSKELERKVISTAVIQPKQDQIIETGENTLLSRDGYIMHFDRVINVTALAYCPGTPESGCPIDSKGRSNCTGSTSGVTTTGKKAAAGTGSKNDPHLIAVDPRVIPLGSLVYIEGYGIGYAADRGSSITGNKIDILMETHEKALRFGRKSLKVYVLKNIN